MANGTLGTMMTVANQYVNPYSVPTGAVSYATISINVVNTNASATRNIKIAIGDSTTTTSNIGDAANQKFFIEYNTQLSANGGVLERTCIPVSAGDKVFVSSEGSDVAVRVFGLEQTVG